MLPKGVGLAPVRSPEFPPPKFSIGVKSEIIESLAHSSSPVDPSSGIAIDFGDLKQVVRETIVSQVDHRDLNGIIDNPTAENVALWAWKRLVDVLPGLVEVELHETESCSVVYRGE